MITSIRPLQSIISNLTKDVDNNISLIIDHNESLHNYHLKPSKIKDLHNSNVIIIVDKNFEIFLNKVLDSLNSKSHSILEIAKFPGIKLQKTTGDHHHHEDTHDHHEDEQHEEHDHHHHHSMYDYHVWLDVEIVKTSAMQIVKKLSTIDSQNKDKYEANLKVFLDKLEDLDQKIKIKLKQVKDKNFIVTHNAYQYFINRYGLQTPKSITIDHDHNIGAKTFLDLQNSIKENKVDCIFEEPQFESSIIRKLKENSNIRTDVLDAEWGSDNIAIEEVYFSIMNNLTESFVRCLK